MKIIENFYKSRPPRIYQKFCTTLRSDRKGLLVLVSPKSTNMPPQFIKNISPHIKIMETLLQSTPKNYPTSTYLSADSLAKLLVSLENEKALTIPEERSSLTLREYCEQNNLDYSFLKMLKGFSATTTEKLSQPSSPRLMSWRSGERRVRKECRSRWSPY